MTEEQIKKIAVKFFTEMGNYQNQKAIDLIWYVVKTTTKAPHKNFRQTVESLAWSVYPVPDFAVDTVRKISTLIGKNTTIVETNGYPYVRHCRIEDIQIKDYAHYRNAIYITYRERNKHTSYGMGIIANTNIAFYEGHIEGNHKKVMQHTPVFIQRKDD